MRLRWWVFLSTILAILSFLVLRYVVTHIWPSTGTIIAWPQSLLFLLMFTGLSAGAVPVTAYMNYRFARPGWVERDRGRLLRQGGG
jgi:Sec-independent protein secretion pathway component TatC